MVLRMGNQLNLIYLLMIFLFLSHFLHENVRGFPHSVLLGFFQSYVKHDLRKNKIVVTSITDFFRH
jgi:hypothetical protein